ncbi:MAG: hypothetical protein J5601_06970 [Elusimicrobiaceae bacterium]|nr:hypothetical protein [Elusimicrobiaceae bacterium]
MKNIFWLLASALLVFPFVAQGQQTPASAGKGSVASATQDLDIEARYWALQVRNNNVSFQELQYNAVHLWIGSEERNRALIQRIEFYLQQKDIAQLTPQEQQLLRESRGKKTPLAKKPLPESVSKHKEEIAERREKITALEMKVIDIEARTWAFQIKNGSHTSLEDLKHLSKNWGTLQSYNDKLIALIEKYLGQKEIPFITPEEWERLEENKQAVQNLITNGRGNPAMEKINRMNKQITALQAPVFELDARHWAWRIAEKKDTTLEQLRSYSVQWVGEPAQNARLILAIEENLKKGNTKRLSKTEEKKLRERDEKIRKLLQQTVGH